MFSVFAICIYYLFRDLFFHLPPFNLLSAICGHFRLETGLQVQGAVLDFNIVFLSRDGGPNLKSVTTGRNSDLVIPQRAELRISASQADRFLLRLVNMGNDFSASLKFQKAFGRRFFPIPPRRMMKIWLTNDEG